MSHFTNALHLDPAVRSFPQQLAACDAAMRKLGFRAAKATEWPDRELIFLHVAGRLTVCDSGDAQDLETPLLRQLSRTFGVPVVSTRTADTAGRLVRLAHRGKLVDAFCDNHHLHDESGLKGDAARWGKTFGSEALTQTLTKVFVPAVPGLLREVGAALGIPAGMEDVSFGACLGEMEQGPSFRSSVRRAQFLKAMRGTSRQVKYELRGYRFVKDPAWARLGTGPVDLRWSGTYPLRGDVGGRLALSGQASNRGGEGGPIQLRLSGSALESGLLEVEQVSLVLLSDVSASVRRGVPWTPSLRVRRVSAGMKRVPKEIPPADSRAEALYKASTVQLSGLLRAAREGTGQLGVTLEVRGQSRAPTAWYEVEVSAAQPEEEAPTMHPDEVPLIQQTHRLVREYRLDEARALADEYRQRFPEGVAVTALDELVSRAERA